MKKLNILLIILIAFWMWPSLGSTHPGRLDGKGCHNVHKDWEYKDGRVVKAGTYHCHRALGRMRLDGKEALRDPIDPGQPADCLDRAVKILKEMDTWFDDLLDFFLVTKTAFTRHHEQMKTTLAECGNNGG